MQPTLTNRNDFYKHYWNYYLTLEQDFINTEDYAAIDTINEHTYSNQYLKLYQAICSEIDVVAKCYCKQIDMNFKGSKINQYCKCIIDDDPTFSDIEIEVIGRDIALIKPWKDWNYIIEKNSDNRDIINSHNPVWWSIYNKVKHNRTTFNSDTGLQYYKLANQENVISALSALFILNMRIHRTIALSSIPSTNIFPDTQSSLLKMKEWTSNFIRPSDTVFQIIDGAER